MKPGPEALPVLYALLVVFIVLLFFMIGLLIFSMTRWRYNRLILPIGNKVKIPFRFIYDFTAVQHLEKRRKSDSTAIIPLLELYSKLIKRAPQSRYPRLLAGFYLNMGNVYREWLTGDHIANLMQAISCYNEVLHIANTIEDSSYVTLAQINLGAAYLGLPTGDRTTNLKQAIRCCREALQFLTLENTPSVYALAQSNLGIAYGAMPTGDRAANLKQAIACYQEALRFYTAEVDPRNYALTQSNLGAAYLALPTGDRAANLKQAITHCQQALQFLTAEADPQGYALAQNNLGAAYLALPTGDRAANLKQAIACWRGALKVWTAEADPRHYALAQNNLGNAYRDLPDGNRAANKAQAISCYHEALLFRTRETTPFEYLTTNRDLADLHFLQEEWQAALDGYLAAIDAGNQLYRAGLSSESKAAETAVTVDIYRHAAFTAVRCGRVNEALLILEQGKTRLLTEVLRLRIPRPANVPDEAWIAFEKAGLQVRTVQSEEDHTEGTNEKIDLVEVYKAREQKAQNAQNALNTAVKHVQAYAPNFLQPLDLPTIQAQLPDEHTVFIAFCITDKGSVGLVVYRNQENIQAVELLVFTRTHLRRLLYGGGAAEGWQEAYLRSKVERNEITFKTWKKAIENMLAELGRYLLEPLHRALSPGIERIIFLPSSELFLLPLHAAPLSDDAQVLVCDQYQVSYAPSINVLANTRAKAMPIATPSLYAVINPEDDPSTTVPLSL